MCAVVRVSKKWHGAVGSAGKVNVARGRFRGQTGALALSSIQFSPLARHITEIARPVDTLSPDQLIRCFPNLWILNAFKFSSVRELNLGINFADEMAGHKVNALLVEAGKLPLLATARLWLVCGDDSRGSRHIGEIDFALLHEWPALDGISKSTYHRSTGGRFVHAAADRASVPFALGHPRARPWTSLSGPQYIHSSVMATRLATITSLTRLDIGGVPHVALYRMFTRAFRASDRVVTLRSDPLHPHTNPASILLVS